MTRCRCLYLVERRVSLHVRLQLRKLRREAHLHAALLKLLGHLKQAWIQISVMLQLIVSRRELYFSECLFSLSSQIPLFTLFFSPFSLSLKLPPQVPGWCLVRGLRAQIGQERQWGSTGRTRPSSRECLNLRYLRSRRNSYPSLVGNHVV